MQTLFFDIGGMTCGGCGVKVQHRLTRIDGVSHAAVTLHPGIATVLVDCALVSPAQIISTINQAGFSATLRPAPPQTPEQA